MWRASRRLIVECINYVVRCGRVNVELDDIPDYEIQDVPVYLQPQTFDIPVLPRQQDDPQHRPDAPYTRRRSPPEVVSKMLQAIDEMNETKLREIVTPISQLEEQLEPKNTTAPTDDFLDNS